MSHHPYFLTPKPFHPHSPLFVFLPGMDGTGELLHTQTDTLDQCFDLRSLAIPQSNFSDWDELTNSVLDLITKEQRQKPEKTTYLCGESFGGCLALKVLEKAPELFHRVILVNPASSFRQRPYLAWGAVGTGFMPEPIYRSSTVLILPFLAAMGRIAPRDRRALLNAMKSVPPQTVRWRLSLLDEFAVDPQSLQQTLAPVLLLAAASDRILPSVEEAEQLAEHFPQSQVVVLPDSGHTCLLETDNRLCDILQEADFLEERAREQLFAAS
ncbi:alpha/beta hydrolase fold protein [Halothece sp. PCC 7418]|uniref:alpha/beta fold hydrolase n=1 Tax=Halothece sp. (strain PCC 7418) TaxID=65093 RepID=UPI0002A05F09|nr:alpha/beta fold hydrolase [Halothece sp. PCC 7418]AFZ45842.1 alpha/beta hydrolase fold protein [Halothece sp. PCC 7418]